MSPVVGKLYETQNGLKVLCISTNENTSIVYGYEAANVYEIKNAELLAEWAQAKEYEGYVSIADPELANKAMFVLKGEPVDWEFLKGKTIKISMKVL